MDWLTRLLMAIDAVKTQWNNKHKKSADDYYHLVSAVNDFTVKMNDGSMMSFFSLKGFAAMLSEAEQHGVADTLQESLKGFFKERGYTLQLVDISDPSLTRRRLKKSMQPSFDELKNIGIDSPVFIEDYLDFVASKTVWSDQYLVLQTSPLANQNQKDKKAKETDEQKSMSSVIKNGMQTGVGNQSVFLSNDDMEVLALHEAFSSTAYTAFAKNGLLIKKMNVERGIKAQKEALYGDDCPENWKPSFGQVFVEKKPQSNAGDKATVTEGPLVSQVVDQGGREDTDSTGIFIFGDRYFTTFSLAIPQARSDKMKDYQALRELIPNKVGYMCSYRIESDPFSTPEYRVENMYTTVSSIVPFTQNAQIRDARREVKNLHEAGEKLSGFLSMTIVLHAKDLAELKANIKLVKKAIASWNDAQFRGIEQDITQGLFETLPGAIKRSETTQVLESLSDIFYQSPIFCDAIMYETGYLHFLSEHGRPYPFEDQSSININFNVYCCGISGSGKSTLLSMLNLALLAKAKANPKLRGEMPFIFNVDFGKTSFGMVETLKLLIDQKKSYLFLTHEMTTGIESSYNIHDLPFGRTTPTMRHKTVIVRFLATLICEMTKSKGNYSLKFSEIQDMIKDLVDAVYDYRKVENEPRTFESAEFKHKSTLDVMQKLGIQPQRHHSYYWLSEEVMRLSKGKSIRHAMLLRRYAMPRLADYSEVMSSRQELGEKYGRETLGNGATYRDYFLRRVSQAIKEYPCFNRVTKINLDVARMVSIDIKNVCGEDSQRKAIFGAMALAMFMVKKENLEESPDLLSDVDELFIPYLKRMDEINTHLPGVLNVEESHVLQSLFEEVLVENMRQNRKANWGLRAFSQHLLDPSPEFFSSCSTVFITSDEARSGNHARFQEMQLSRKERTTIEGDLSDKISTFFAYIVTKSSGDTKVPGVRSKLNSLFPSTFIWASQSDQTDRMFKKDALTQLGFDNGLKRISRLFSKGKVKHYFDDESLKDMAAARGFDSVYNMLMDLALGKIEEDERLMRLL